MKWLTRTTVTWNILVSLQNSSSVKRVKNILVGMAIAHRHAGYSNIRTTYLYTDEP